MDLKKLSASALTSADLCMARYAAEAEAGYDSSEKSTYALMGSSVHFAFEKFVKGCFIDKTAIPTIEYLLDLFDIGFMKIFETADRSGEEYFTCRDLVKKWFYRTDWDYFDVISVEQKKTFYVRTSIGAIPLNYVIDRLDCLGPKKYRIVDYKTSSIFLTKDELKKKIQARIYALAIQIEFPDAEQTWVAFDMLKQDQPVEILFSKEENAATYRMLQRAAERIIAADRNKLKETLNTECMFCIRKASCSAITRNVNAGGIHSYNGNLEEMINARALLDFQQKAALSALKELDRYILQHLEELELTETETDLVALEVKVSKTRQVDAEKVLEIVGDEVFSKYGGHSISMAEFDRLLKSGELAQPTLESVKKAVTFKYGEPRITTKLKGNFNT